MVAFGGTEAVYRGGLGPYPSVVILRIKFSDYFRFVVVVVVRAVVTCTGLCVDLDVDLDLQLDVQCRERIALHHRKSPHRIVLYCTALYYIIVLYPPPLHIPHPSLHLCSNHQDTARGQTVR